MKKMATSSLLLVLTLSVSFLVADAQPAFAAYNNDNLISNSLFRDKDSMSKNEIQTFLDSTGGALASWSGADAAQVIYDASQDYGVSPKVIMATIQKEQSLITDPSPHHTQYDYAMGYGCPTTGSCSFKGFAKQVDNGTWQLRLNYERARGNDSWWNPDISYACAEGRESNPDKYYKPGLFPGNSVKFYDHIEYRHYATVDIANAATAALYCYTPHVYNPSGDPVYYSGSYNFVTSYEAWWGSTLVPVQRVRSDDGDPTQYAVYDGKKQGIPTGNVLRAWGIDDLPIQTWTAEQIENTPNHTGILSRKVKHSRHGAYYLIDDKGGFTVNSSSMRKIWGFSSSPSQVSDDLLTLVNVSGSATPYVTTNESATIYLVDEGELHTITSPDTLHAWRKNEPIRVISTSLTNIMPENGSIEHNRISNGSDEFLVSKRSRYKIPTSLLNQYPDSAKEVSEGLVNYLSNKGSIGRFIKSNKASGVYLVDRGSKHGLPSLEVYDAYKSSSDPHGNTTTLHHRAFSLIDNGGNRRSTLVGDETDYYMLRNGKKHIIPTGLHDQYSVSTHTVEVSSELLGAIPNADKVATPFVTSSRSPAVFLLDNGERRGISSPTRLKQLKPSDVHITKLTNKDLNSYNYVDKLSAHLGDGENEFLIDRGKKYSIGDSSTKNDWGLTSSTLRQLQPETLDYFENGDPLGVSVKNGNKYYLISESGYYSTDSENIASIWNINTAQKLSGHSLSSLSDRGTLTRFAESSDTSSRTIYTVDNGSLLGLRSLDQLFNIGYKGERIVKISPERVQERKSSSGLHRFLIENSSGALRVIDDGNLRDIYPEYTDDWKGSHEPTTLSDSYLSLLGSGSTLHGSIKGSSSATIYAMLEGKKRPVSNPETFREHYSPHSYVSDELIELIPEGAQAPSS